MTITEEMKRQLQKDAGIPNMPTDLTYTARMAVSGEEVGDGRMAYDWGDKPHRVVYDLCCHIEALEAAMSSAPTPATAVSEVDLLNSVIGDICTFRDMQPEEDESWESWYFAAFDMLTERVRETFKRMLVAALAPVPAREAVEVKPLETDEDALDILRSYGIVEKKNGVIREDRRVFNKETWTAVCFLCDEWDFVFEDTAPPDDTINRADVEKMICDWQLECVNHPALHNQGNVLRSRLRNIKPWMSIAAFQSVMDDLASAALSRTTEAEG